MIKINSEKELLGLLKIISSEAVGISKRLNENADPTTSNYLKQYEKDEDTFGTLSEQEDEEDEAADDEEVEAEEAEDAEESPSEDDFVDSGVSFDSITRAINSLRAGKSLKDSGVKKQAADYYDKLSESERKALFVFLEALSEIITGQIKGKEAQDPSEPPVSISFSDQEEEEEVEPPSTEEPEEEVSEEEPEEKVPEEEQEDTTPPIRVNESQDLTDLRRKVRRMMLRG
tara:strand:- start:1001 stop:1690 length:690 start_codon:yes stop_codon:yes gene_type:complete